MINLQTPGEHASCGPPLTSSGFTYHPDVFMANDSENALSTYDNVPVTAFAQGSTCVFKNCDRLSHFLRLIIKLGSAVYYYNFAWPDYGEASLSGLLDMTKVLSFALQEGRVAIHCHAGKLMSYDHTYRR